MDKDKEEMIRSLVSWYQKKIKELEEEYRKSVIDMCGGDEEKAQEFMSVTN